jgi:uncharacterized protein (TIGR02118 family)
VGARFVALWSKPDDVEGFEEHYRTKHVPITSRWPGVRASSVTRVTGAPMGGEPIYHLMFVAELATQDDLDALFASEPVSEALKDARDIMRRYGTTLTVLTGSDL